MMPWTCQRCGVVKEITRAQLKAGKKWCNACSAALNKERSVAYHRHMRALGYCQDCSAVAVPKMSRCAPCLARLRERYARAERRRG